MTSSASSPIPRAFIWRRLHSLTGLWLVIFLFEHLLTNSQAALLLGENGQGFVRMVNWLHNLPYLQVIELFLLGIPIAVHLFWGVRYALQSKNNSRASDGSSPSLKHGRNRAYSWQRITSWILLVLLLAHIVKFRFLEYPKDVRMGTSSLYFVKVGEDPGLASVSKKLGVTLFDKGAIAEERNPAILEKLESFSLEKGEVIGAADNFGTATLLSVRNTFRSPIYAIIYTIFVLAAVFHGFNGLWTFMITWGILIKRGSQLRGVAFCLFLTALVSFFGLAAIWGTYYLNLRS